MPVTMGILSKETLVGAPTPHTVRYMVRVQIDPENSFDVEVVANDIESRVDNQVLRDLIPDRNTRQTIMRFALQAVEAVREKDHPKK